MPTSSRDPISGQRKASPVWLSPPVTVLVTEPEYKKAENLFQQASDCGLICRPAPPEEYALAESVSRHQARNVIVGVERYGGALYDALPAGSVIARFGVGYDGLDLARATRAGILCCNTPGVLDRSVAEHTLMLIMSAARRLPQMHNAVCKGCWVARGGVTELHNKRLVVVGAGAIGSQVARMASFGLGMQVTGCDTRSLDENKMRADYGYAAMVQELCPALANADFVSLHVPAMPATRHLINAETLSFMPDHAWLINTSRGMLVDEISLFDALQAGAIAGAALDVFEHEPYRPSQQDKDLRKLKNFIMTPHAASSTTDACRRVTEKVLEAILAAEQKMYDAVSWLNPEALAGLR